MKVHIDEEFLTDRVYIQKIVLQGDLISPKLSILVQENVFEELTYLKTEVMASWYFYVRSTIKSS